MFKIANSFSLRCIIGTMFRRKGEGLLVYPEWGLDFNAIAGAAFFSSFFQFSLSQMLIFTLFEIFPAVVIHHSSTCFYMRCGVAGFPEVLNQDWITANDPDGIQEREVCSHRTQSTPFCCGAPPNSISKRLLRLPRSRYRSWLQRLSKRRSLRRSSGPTMPPQWVRHVPVGHQQRRCCARFVGPTRRRRISARGCGR
jgi:hypothetical protein